MFPSPITLPAARNDKGELREMTFTSSLFTLPYYLERAFRARSLPLGMTAKPTRLREVIGNSEW